MMLEIKDIHVVHEDKPILQGVNLTIQKGEIHALMGPNGAGALVILVNQFKRSHHPVDHISVVPGAQRINGTAISRVSTSERHRHPHHIVRYMHSP